MNSAAAIEAIKRFTLVQMREHPMFQDPISLTALIASAVLNVVTLGLLVLKVHHAGYPVPVHYLSLVGFDKVGSWFSVYRFFGFGLAVTIINAMLAGKAFQRHRLTSFFLLLGAVAVNLLCLVISLAFAVIV